MTRLVLDAGAFVAFEKGDVRLRARLAAARRRGEGFVTTSAVVAQVWRDGSRQALLARLLAGTLVEAPGEAAGRRAGELLAATGTRDVVDALLAALVQGGDTVLTSDRADIGRLLAAARIGATLIAV